MWATVARASSLDGASSQTEHSIDVEAATLQRAPWGPQHPRPKIEEAVDRRVLQGWGVVNSGCYHYQYLVYQVVYTTNPAARNLGACLQESSPQARKPAKPGLSCPGLRLHVRPSNARHGQTRQGLQ